MNVLAEMARLAIKHTSRCVCVVTFLPISFETKSLSNNFETSVNCDAWPFSLEVDCGEQVRKQ